MSSFEIKTRRIQVDNSLRFNVNLIVLENESYLEIKDRFNGTTKIVPASRKKLSIRVNFYKSRWYYRLWSRLPYGHVNITLTDNTILNKDLNEFECGIMKQYPIKPDLFIETEVRLEDLQKAINEAVEPLKLTSIFRNNCFKVVLIALGLSNMKEFRAWIKAQLIPN